mgnify:CR=1 FL=1
MPAVGGTPKQRSSLEAYLQTQGAGPSGKEATGETASTKTAGVPKAVAVALSPLDLQGQQVFQRYSCETCHGAGGLHGTAAAPGLAGTASLLSASALEHLLRHHSIQMQNGNMPPTNMNERDLKSVVAYIRSMPTSADNN